MKFANPTEKTVGPFMVGGRSHVVKPGETCVIADELAFVVKTRGLPLVEVVDMPKPVEAVKASEPAPMLSAQVAELPLMTAPIAQSHDKPKQKHK